MTVDDLVKIYNEALWHGEKRPQDTADHAGLRAVVQALRPKLVLWFHAIDQSVTERAAARFADDFINEILGSDGGEKVAGGLPDDAVPIPLMHPETAISAPATDAAPAVCEWRLTNWTPDCSWYERKCDGETYERDLRHLACPSCGKPITFTEANHG